MSYSPFFMKPEDFVIELSQESLSPIPKLEGVDFFIPTPPPTPETLPVSPDLSDQHNVENPDLPQDMWKVIFGFAGIDMAFSKGMAQISRTTRNILYDENVWYEYCKVNGLGFSTESEFENARFKHSWIDEVRAYLSDQITFKILTKTIFEKKKNVFITGGAGTGKSYKIALIKKEFNERNLNPKFEPTRFAVTASTGMAAWTLGNETTIHSFSKFGIFDETLENAISRIKKMRRNHYIIKQWLKLDTLFIDEISMLPPEYFHKLDRVVREIRAHHGKGDRLETLKKPFGGIQLILSGDFAQLPPAVTQLWIENEQRVKFLFQMQEWPNYAQHTALFNYSHRQKGDTAYFNILKNVRIGRATESDRLTLSKRFTTAPQNIGDLPYLYSHKKDVASENQRRLDMLVTVPVIFSAIESFSGFDNTSKSNLNKVEMLKRAREKCIVPTTLVLKIGCKVMLLKNIDISQGLVNGACGVVVSLNPFLNQVDVDFGVLSPPSGGGNRGTGGRRTITPADFVFSNPTTEKKNNPPKITISQIPLVPFYASTIHKSQGLSMREIFVNLADIHEPGAGYVAFSRVSTSKGLHLTSRLTAKALAVDPNVCKFYLDLEKKNSYTQSVSRPPTQNTKNTTGISSARITTKTQLRQMISDIPIAIKMIKVE